MADRSSHDEVHAPVEDIEVPVGLKVLVLAMIVLLLLMSILFVAVLAEIRLFQFLDAGSALLVGVTCG